MEIISVTKGRTCKNVLVQTTASDCKDEILAFAMAAAGESKSSLFGASVGPPDVQGTRRVRLDTD